MDAAEYVRNERACLDDLERSQATIAETLLFQPSVDAALGKLEWLEDGKAYLRAEGLLIGSWGGGQPRWRWGMVYPRSNPGTGAKTDSVRELRSWNVEFDNPEFFETTEQHAWGLAAVACRHLNGQGVYSFEHEGACSWCVVCS